MQLLKTNLAMFLFYDYLVEYTTAQKRFSADWVTFTEEILNGKLHFLCSALTAKTLPSLKDV